MYRSIYLLFCLFCVILAKYDVRECKCLVCKASLDEAIQKINTLDPDKKVEVGGYRLDGQGNYVKKTVSQLKSEIALSDVLEEVCKIMEDYVRATWKSNGTLTLMKLIVDGKMNALSTDVDFVQDDDLNKSLQYYCEEIFEEYEESLIKYLQSDVKDIHKKLCYEEIGICGDPASDHEEL